MPPVRLLYQERCSSRRWRRLAPGRSPAASGWNVPFLGPQRAAVRRFAFNPARWSGLLVLSILRPLRGLLVRGRFPDLIRVIFRAPVLSNRLHADTLHPSFELPAKGAAGCRDSTVLSARSRFYHRRPPHQRQASDCRSGGFSHSPGAVFFLVTPYPRRGGHCRSDLIQNRLSKERRELSRGYLVE